MRFMIAIRIVALLASLALAGETWARGGGGRGGGGFKGGHFSGYRGGFKGGHFSGRRGGFGGGHFGYSGRGHRFHYGHSRLHSSFGFYFGPDWGWPSYSYSPYYSYPPTVVEVPVSPPVYIEQANTSTTITTLHWNYCDNPEGYSPYVQECPGGWRKIAAYPSGQEAGYWYRCASPEGYYPYLQQCPAGWQKLIPEPVATHTPP